MTLAFSDWLVVALSLVASAVFALIYRRASESLDEYS